MASRVRTSPGLQKFRAGRVSRSGLPQGPDALRSGGDPIKKEDPRESRVPIGLESGWPVLPEVGLHPSPAHLCCRRRLLGNRHLPEIELHGDVVREDRPDVESEPGQAVEIVGTEGVEDVQRIEGLTHITDVEVEIERILLQGHAARELGLVETKNPSETGNPSTSVK